MNMNMKTFITFAAMAAIGLAGCGGVQEDETSVNPDTAFTEVAGATEGSESLSQEVTTVVTTEAALPEVPAFTWKTEAPESHGMDAEGLEELHKQLKDSKVYGMVTVKDGVIIDEFYNEGYDENSVFPMHSCSKSVTDILIGIALEEGFIGSVNEPISKYIDRATGEKGEITIEDLLTQRSGLDWDEWNSYEVWNEFRSADNWVDFILGRELVYEPGTHFTYSTGNTHLLSAALENATGKNQLDFANEVLFEPLGMDSVSWGTDPQGITDGGNGIVMSLRDGARFGQMCLDGGEWQGERIVSSDWIDESVRAHSAGYGDLNGDYGYQWWSREYQGYEVYYAYGYGGQYIFVVPELNLVNVMASDYPEASYRAREYFTEYLLGECVDRGAE